MKKVEKVLEYIAPILMVLLASVITIQIVSRFLGHPLLGTTELSTFCLIYLSFLGGSLAYYKDKGFKITLLTDKFPAKVKKYNNIFIMLCSMVLLLIVIYSGYFLMLKLWNSYSSIMHWSTGLIILVMLVSYSLIFIKILTNLRSSFQRK